jgi:hypothetical protein
MIEMDDTVRQRMKWAIEELGRRDGVKKPENHHYTISRMAGKSRNYLYDSWNPARKKGSIGEYIAIAKMTGINLTWLFDAEGEPFEGDQDQKLDREDVLLCIRTMLKHFCGLSDVTAADAAQAIVGVLEHPPSDTPAIDKRDSIHIGILTLLRLYEP